MEYFLGTLVLTGFYLLLAIPGIVILLLVWRHTKKSNITLRLTMRSIFISLAFTPAIYGHAGILPAIYVIFFPEIEYKVPALLSLFVVGGVALLIMLFKSKQSGAGKSKGQTR